MLNSYINLLKNISLRNIAITASIFSFAVVIIAIILEFSLHLSVCPLCLVQRVIFILLGICFLISAIVATKKMPFKITSCFASFLSIIGLTLAIRQSYLQIYPNPGVTCGASFDYVLLNFPILDAIAFLFAGSGNCQEIQLKVLGLSTPMWSTAAFLSLTIISVYSLLKKVK